MYTTSDAYKTAVNSNSTVISWRGKVTDVDGKQYSVDPTNIGENGMTITKDICANSNIEIGTAYVGQLTLDVYLNVDRYRLFGGTVDMEFGLELADGSMEWLPCGTFDIQSAEVTEGKVKLTCYDFMQRFNVVITQNPVGKTPYKVISEYCENRGVTMGTTEAELNAMPNGSYQLPLWSSDGSTQAYTEQQIIGYLAQAMCAYAYIGQDNKMYIKQFSQTVDKTISEAGRFSLTLSDYETKFSELSYIMMSNNSAHVIGDSNDYLIYSAGSNPMLQSSDEGVMETYYTAVLNKLKEISYTPFTASLPIDLSLGVGDIVEFTGGKAVAGKCAPITSVTYKSSGSMEIKCEGANPKLKDRAGTDSQLASIASALDEKTLRYYNFTNTSVKKVSDNAEVKVIDIEFTVSATTQLTLMGNIQASGSPKEELVKGNYSEKDLLLSLRFLLNGAEIKDYYPKSTTSGGYIIIPLYYPLTGIQGGSSNRLIGYLRADGGSAEINKYDIKATIFGQGLYAKFVDGNPTVEESIDLFTPRIPRPTIMPMTDQVKVRQQAPLRGAVTQSISFITPSIPRPIVMGMNETVSSSEVYKAFIMDGTDAHLGTFNNTYVYVDTTPQYKLIGTYTYDGTAQTIDSGSMSEAEFDTAQFSSITDIKDL